VTSSTRTAGTVVARAGGDDRDQRKPVVREQQGYAGCVIPWIIFALVVVPLVVVGFVVSRRRTAAGEHPAGENAEERARTEQEFAEAEAYDAKWREEDKERHREERLP
jgi:hypothetical protein